MSAIVRRSVGVVSKEKRDYSGVYFANYFRVSHPIEVLALAFYGPHGKTRANYNIYVEVFKTPFPGQEGDNLHKEELRNFEASGEIFWVDFKQAVYIERNVWHRVEFRLDGPATKHAEKMLCDVDVDGVTVDVLTWNPTRIHFDFLFGSMQMPALEFHEVLDPQNHADSHSLKINTHASSNTISRWLCKLCGCGSQK